MEEIAFPSIAVRRRIGIFSITMHIGARQGRCPIACPCHTHRKIIGRECGKRVPIIEMSCRRYGISPRHQRKHLRKDFRTRRIPLHTNLLRHMHIVIPREIVVRRDQLRPPICHGGNGGHCSNVWIRNKHIQHILHCMRREHHICMKEEKNRPLRCPNPLIHCICIAMMLLTAKYTNMIHRIRRKNLLICRRTIIDNDHFIRNTHRISYRKEAAFQMFTHVVNRNNNA